MKYPNRNKVGKASRKHSAKKRQEAYDKLTPGEKLAELDKTLGLNTGATKQRAKLAAQLKKNST